MRLFLLLFACRLWGQVIVPTAQYDNARTGANLQETVLTPQKVASAQFGKLWTARVDGDVHAQPLFVPKLEIPGKGAHDVLFVATEHDSVYAFDAAGTPAQALWQVSFADASKGVDPVPVSALHCPFISPDQGITPTPVIDAATRTMYVLVRTSERNRGGQDLYYQRLHAIDITTGAERAGSPVLIRASMKGSAWFGLVGKDVAFHALLENPRAAMLLSRGQVYIAWGSACDLKPYYGWVMSYDARTLQQTGVFNASPDAGESGIWQSDAGIAADAAGNVYALTGNGDFTASGKGRDFGDSVLKLGMLNGALGVLDYFTPSNESRLNRTDADLGSSGPVLLPDLPGPHPHVILAAGKAGTIYVIDRDKMGKFHAGSDSHAIQTLPKAAGTGAFGAPAYWNGHVYYFGSNDVLKDFAVENGMLSAGPVHQGTFKFKDPGAIPSISANGNRDGIVWLIITKGWRDPDRDAILQAYDAADVSRMLYRSDAKAEDSDGRALRFTIPMVANGRVYVGTRSAVYCYGLTAPPPKTAKKTPRK